MDKQTTRPANRFERGSGVYTCQSCSRRTRSTGRGDNEHCRLCVDCYDLSGIENMIADGDETPELLQEAAELREIIVSKGGVLK